MSDVHVEGAEALARLARDLRRFDHGKEVVKAMRTELRAPVKGARAKIRAHALAILPARNGLNAWIARSKVISQIRIGGREAYVRLRGTRSNQTGRKSDLTSVDRGRLRAPSWGHRGPGAWHTQNVRTGFFTNAVRESDWTQAIDNAVDEAARFFDGA